MYTCLVDKDWNFTFVITRDYRNKLFRNRYLCDEVYRQKQITNRIKNDYKRKQLYKQDRLHIRKNINGELVTVFKE